MSHASPPLRRLVASSAATLLLALALLFQTGCTLIGATAGAVVDTAIIASPVWAPSMLENGYIGDIQQHTRISPAPSDYEAVSLVGDAAQSAATIAVQPFAYASEPSPSATSHRTTFKWWALAPLVPFYRATTGLSGMEYGVAPGGGTFVDQPDQSLILEIPYDHLPPELRQAAQEDPSSPLVQQYVRGTLPAQLRLSAPEPGELDGVLWDEYPDALRYNLGLRLATAAQKSAPQGEVFFASPLQEAYYELKKKEGISVTPDQTTVRIQVPAENYKLVAKAAPTTVPETAEVILSGQIIDYRVVKTQYLYGITLPLANLLSWLGPPTARARLEMDLRLTATRPGEPEPYLVREANLRTDRKSMGGWYGGDAPDRLEDDLNGQVEAILNRFATEALNSVNSRD